MGNVPHSHVREKMFNLGRWSGRLLLVLSSLLTSLTAVHGQMIDALSDSLPSRVPEISILLCAPSQEMAYTIYGHAAIRVRSVEDPSEDYVYNYGVFDFDTPHFFYRFIKGETDTYKVQREPFDYFLSVYLDRGSEVYEHHLALSPEQVAAVVSYLNWNLQPEHRYYRYNFAFDNCSTRPFRILEETLPRGERIELPAGEPSASLRSLINAYATHFPWYRLGTDLALGVPADSLMHSVSQTFLPMHLDQLLSGAVLVVNGGEPQSLVSYRQEYTPIGEKYVGKEPWYMHPVFVLGLLLLLTLLLSFVDRVRGLWTILLHVLYAMAGVLLFFIAFVSIHPCTSPNINLLLFHPLLFFSGFAFSSRSLLRRLGRALHYLNLFLVGVFLVLVAVRIQVSSLPILILAFTSAVLSLAVILRPDRFHRFR